MLIELAIGDAYGAGFEYADRAMIARANDLSRYVEHPRHRLLPGHYTDDTQMSLAIAELIVSGDEWTRERLAEKFVEAFKRDPREGYASGFYAFLQRVQSGRQFLAEIRPTSDKSGAAMRAAPIGVYPTVPEVIERARLQARLTHDTEDGTNAAVAAALLAHYCLYRLGPKAEAGAFIERHVAGHWATPWRGKVGSKGWMSVRAAITAVAEQDRLSDLLRACVDFSGDVDTVAAIALAAGAHCPEIAPDLPEHLLYGLEDGSYGRTYITALDAKVLARVPSV